MKKLILLILGAIALTGCNSTPRLQANQVTTGAGKESNGYGAIACSQKFAKDKDIYFTASLISKSDFTSDNVFQCTAHSLTADQKKIDEMREKLGHEIASEGGTYSTFDGNTLYTYGPGVECVSTPTSSICN